MLKEDIEPESLWYNSPYKKGINKCNIHLDSGVTIRCKYVKNWIVKVFFDIIILIVSHILSNICPKTPVMRIKDSSLGNKIVVFRNATIYIVICYPSPISFNQCCFSCKLNLQFIMFGKTSKWDSMYTFVTYLCIIY